MRRAIIFALLLVFPTSLHAELIKWEGKPISVSISTERLTRIEFAENLRSVFLSRSDIAVEKEDRSLYVRALAPEIGDTLFVVGETGTTYEINLSTSDNPDQTVVISHIPKSLQVQAEQARRVPALDLIRSMMRGLSNSEDTIPISDLGSGLDLGSASGLDLESGLTIDLLQTSKFGPCSPSVLVISRTYYG